MMQQRGTAALCRRGPPGPRHEGLPRSSVRLSVRCVVDEPACLPATWHSGSARGRRPGGPGAASARPNKSPDAYIHTPSALPSAPLAPGAAPDSDIARPTFKCGMHILEPCPPLLTPHIYMPSCQYSSGSSGPVQPRPFFALPTAAPPLLQSSLCTAASKHQARACRCGARADVNPACHTAAHMYAQGRALRAVVHYTHRSAAACWGLAARQRRCVSWPECTSGASAARTARAWTPAGHQRRRAQPQACSGALLHGCTGAARSPRAGRMHACTAVRQEQPTAMLAHAWASVHTCYAQALMD